MDLFEFHKDRADHYVRTAYGASVIVGLLSLILVVISLFTPILNYNVYALLM